MMACSGLTDFLALVLGAFISGLVGYFSTRFARHSEAKDILAAKIYNIITLPKDTHFHGKSFKIIQDALWEARPHLKRSSFDACIGILREYGQIDYYELAEQKGKSVEWTLANDMKTVDQRVTEYADRFAKEIK